MLEAILGISVLELIATIVILVDFGPETIRKIKVWERSEKRWFR
jgi:hypothetical protein